MTPIPSLSGSDDQISDAMSHNAPVFLEKSGIDFGAIRSAFAIALHMHQPLIPAPGGRVISNLQHMFEHPEIQDAHNAPVFRECYRRMADFIPQLLAEGKRPRVMLDYSGCLLHGLEAMGAHDVIDGLRYLAQDHACRQCVEWLGTAWGHAVAPSTPPADFRRHVRAWQRQFATMFGAEALSRVRGFSPPEMALANHPDVAYEFVRTLKECGFQWVLVQEHTIERAGDGAPVRGAHVPHRLICRNSRGEVASIIAVIKTQGSDTKLVGQMQPYGEAKSLGRVELAGRSIPPLVTQIGDGENGGVMMNEFPQAFMQAMREASGSAHAAMNGTEYLEHLSAMGITEADLPEVRPLFHHRIFSRFEAASGPGQLEAVLKALRGEDNRFHVEGGSWTNHISWVRGYEGVMGPIEQVSALYADKIGPLEAKSGARERDEALFYLLLTQTSCFRYWGQGEWTDHARELCRRATEAIHR